MGFKVTNIFGSEFWPARVIRRFSSLRDLCIDVSSVPCAHSYCYSLFASKFDSTRLHVLVAWIAITSFSSGSVCTLEPRTRSGGGQMQYKRVPGPTFLVCNVFVCVWSMNGESKDTPACTLCVCVCLALNLALVPHPTLRQPSTNTIYSVQEFRGMLRDLTVAAPAAVTNRVVLARFFFLLLLPFPRRCFFLVP